MKYVLVIVADVNDADYVKGIYHNVPEETIENVIKPVAEAIKAINSNYNWYTIDEREPSPEVMYKDVLTAEQIDIFGSYVPFNDALGYPHTIDQIYYLPQTEIIKLIWKNGVWNGKS